MGLLNYPYMGIGAGYDDQQTWPPPGWTPMRPQIDPQSFSFVKPEPLPLPDLKLDESSGYGPFGLFSKKFHDGADRFFTGLGDTANALRGHPTHALDAYDKDHGGGGGLLDFGQGVRDVFNAIGAVGNALQGGGQEAPETLSPNLRTSDARRQFLAGQIQPIQDIFVQPHKNDQQVQNNRSLGQALGMGWLMRNPNLFV